MGQKDCLDPLAHKAQKVTLAGVEGKVHMARQA